MAKLLSLPVIVGVVGVVAVAGGLIYATSGYTEYHPKAPAATEEASSSPSSNAGSSASSDSTYTPISHTTADAGTPPEQTPGQRGPGGNRGTPEEQQQRRQQRMQQMATELGLTDAQKQQMEDIRKNTPDREARRAAIMAILTPEQQAKMEQMRAQFQNRGGNGAGGGNRRDAMQGGGAAPANNAPATTTQTGT